MQQMYFDLTAKSDRTRESYMEIRKILLKLMHANPDWRDNGHMVTVESLENALREGYDTQA